MDKFWLRFAVIFLLTVWVIHIFWHTTPAQPDVKVVTFPDQSVDCFIYERSIYCVPYTDDEVRPGESVWTPEEMDNARHIDGEPT